MGGIQRCNTAVSGNATNAGNATANFPNSDPAAVVYLQASPTNVGNVTILGSGSTDGPELTAGSFAPPIGPINNLGQLQYRLATANDVVKWMIIR